MKNEANENMLKINPRGKDKLTVNKMKKASRIKSELWINENNISSLQNTKMFSIRGSIYGINK
ncbi:hypothetical protein KO465_10650 [Candidatus Micrarchaeota archaeon]|jgi:hypothetical protein|nr:hypothetical protein [Candidatus Micrarchaeota archaeon]